MLIAKRRDRLEVHPLFEKSARKKLEKTSYEKNAGKNRNVFSGRVSSCGRGSQSRVCTRTDRCGKRCSASRHGLRGYSRHRGVGRSSPDIGGYRNTARDFCRLPNTPGSKVSGWKKIFAH